MQHKTIPKRSFHNLSFVFLWNFKSLSPNFCIYPRTFHNILIFDSIFENEIKIIKVLFKVQRNLKIMFPSHIWTLWWWLWYNFVVFNVFIVRITPTLHLNYHPYTRRLILLILSGVYNHENEGCSFSFLHAIFLPWQYFIAHIFIKIYITSEICRNIIS